tara:strand:- start:643 stop:1032 length:390 start_codon:yes stop_codon:yes gene_type:complete
MSKFKGQEVVVNLSSKELYIKLSDLNNLKKIIPPEIENFEANTDNCSIKTNGMPELKLFLSEKKPFSKIQLSTKKSPIKFSLNCFITDCGKTSKARIEIDTELNMVMKMMFEKKISDFLNILSERLRTL